MIVTGCSAGGTAHKRLQLVVRVAELMEPHVAEPLPNDSDAPIGLFETPDAAAVVAVTLLDLVH